ncbi:MAG: DNA primase [Candidatus Wallbacteria bacterium HGW-Wallbacteria-1]|jgi:DNA primase|uniref:DNA primase n=1 Tax=Candidatus Wallbacteria bacterium HGW-Wallbacteria-1 TaxID=2013854 RepID=A0A2N1PSF7_9BACT|nr:MAG: DNA primase [Candidatus Wallbacteria bacterium HGW-Wallbacteria-1]
MKGPRHPFQGLVGEMGRIPETLIRRIIESVDIVELVSQYVRLTPAGRSYRGICPFHGEKTPSFNVSPDKGFFKCFGGGCGKSGNALSFLMEIERIGFMEALKILADKTGVSLPESEVDDEALEEEKRRDEIFLANEWASKFFVWYLKQDNPLASAARAYLEQRGFDSNWIDIFKWGLSPGGWSGMADSILRKGMGTEPFEKASLIRTGRRGLYDFFRGRIMIPILSPSGRVLGFGGRVFPAPGINDGEEGPKYLNSPDTPVFTKGRVLYGFYEAKQAIRSSGVVVVVEGYMDRLALARAGVENCVAVLGTALTSHHLELLRPMARHGILLLDSDEAGQTAAERAVLLSQEAGFEFRVANLKGYKDIDEFIASEKAVDLTAIQNMCQEPLDFLIDRAVGRHSGAGAHTKALVVDSLAPYVLAQTNTIVRHAYLQTISRKLNLSPDMIALELRKSGKKGRFSAAHEVKKSATSSKSLTQRGLASDIQAEENIISLMLHSSLFEEAMKCFEEISFEDGDLLAMGDAILGEAENGKFDPERFLAVHSDLAAFDRMVARTVQLPEDLTLLKSMLQQSRKRLEIRAGTRNLKALKEKISELTRFGLPGEDSLKKLVSDLNEEYMSLKRELES